MPSRMLRRLKPCRLDLLHYCASFNIAVRFREMCIFENPAIWGPGGLPSAMDSVLSTFVPPAIMVGRAGGRAGG